MLHSPQQRPSIPHPPPPAEAEAAALGSLQAPPRATASSCAATPRRSPDTDRPVGRMPSSAQHSTSSAVQAAHGHAHRAARKSCRRRSSAAPTGPPLQCHAAPRRCCSERCIGGRPAILQGSLSVILREVGRFFASMCMIGQPAQLLSGKLARSGFGLCTTPRCGCLCGLLTEWTCRLKSSKGEGEEISTGSGRGVGGEGGAGGGGVAHHEAAG